MGLFGFVSEIASATVKVALTPVAVLSDACDVVTGNDATATKKLIKSAGDDVENGIDEILP